MFNHCPIFICIAGQTLLNFLLSGLWAVPLIGWGLGFFLLCRLHVNSLSDYLVSFWAGLTCITLFGQWWHMMMPINGAAAVIVLTAGVVFWIPAWPRHVKNLGEISSYPSLKLFLCLYFLLGLWAANRSVSAPLLIDSGIYHFPVLRWLREYPVVPGLGNLDPKLATNQSYFLYSALLNAFPIKGWSFHFANTLLILMALLMPVKALASLITGRQEFPRILEAFHALTLIPYYILIHSMYMSCPTPDLLIDVLEIVLCGYFLEFLLCPSEKKIFYFTLILLLVPAGIAFKLSFITVGPFFAVATILHLIWDKNLWPWRRPVALCLLFTASLAVLWLATGLIESGYPLYPSRIGGLNVDWKVPKDVLQSYGNSIHNEKGINMPYNDMTTFARWLRFNFIDHDFSLKYPLIMASISAGGAFIMLLLGKIGPSGYIATKPLACIFMGLGLWFVLCPIDRFSSMLFWLVSILLTASICAEITSIHALRAIIAIYFLTALFELGIRIRLVSGSQPEWPNSILISDMFEYKTDCGLLLNVPVPGSSDDAAYLWDYPLPSTLHPQMGLQLRGYSFRNGFRIQSDSKKSESIQDAYRELIIAVAIMNKAVPQQDVPTLHQIDHRIQLICQIFFDRIMEAIPSLSPSLANKLNAILFVSGNLHAAAVHGDLKAMRDNYNQLATLIKTLPSYYPPGTLELPALAPPSALPSPSRDAPH